MKKDKYYGTTLNKHLPKAREIWGNEFKMAV